MNKILLSKSFDPFFNLSFENLLFSQSNPEPHKPILYLWRNSDVVVIGRFQNPWKECNIDKLNADNVHLMRRDTGGGAVYHDTNNICFTFVGNTQDENYRQKNTHLICKALENLGLTAAPSGRNDITINDKKISGAAFREKNGKYIHHGTLLVGTDLTRLANYLNPNEKKLASKGISSVRSRVTNLQNLNSQITIDTVIDSLVKTYCNHYSYENADIQYITEDLLEENSTLCEEYNRLRSWDWVYGKSPEFTHGFDGYFNWGSIEINFLVKNAIIEEISINSDCLDINFIASLSTELEEFKHTEYNIAKIQQSLSKNFAEISTIFE